MSVHPLFFIGPSFDKSCFFSLERVSSSTLLAMSSNLSSSDLRTAVKAAKDNEDNKFHEETQNSKAKKGGKNVYIFTEYDLKSHFNLPKFFDQNSQILFLRSFEIMF